MTEYRDRAENDFALRRRRAAAEAKALANEETGDLLRVLTQAVTRGQLTELEPEIRRVVAAWLADAQEFGRVPKTPAGSLRGDPPEPLPGPSPE